MCIRPNLGFINLNWIAPINVTRRQTLSVVHKCFITAAWLKTWIIVNDAQWLFISWRVCISKLRRMVGFRENKKM